MNTYNLTEPQLLEILRTQRINCANDADVEYDEKRDMYFVDKLSIVNASLPDLPISGAKKEDIPEDVTKCEQLGHFRKVEQPVPSIENYGEPERGINIIEQLKKVFEDYHDNVISGGKESMKLMSYDAFEQAIVTELKNRKVFK